MPYSDLRFPGPPASTVHALAASTRLQLQLVVELAGHGAKDYHQYLLPENSPTTSTLVAEPWPDTPTLAPDMIPT